MFSLSRRLLSTRSKDAGRITGRLQTIWIEPTGIREDSEIEVHSRSNFDIASDKGTLTATSGSKKGLSNPYLTLMKYTYNDKDPVVETEPKVCELNRRIELLRKQQTK